MLWEQAAQDTIDFKKIYVDMTGDVKAGLLLSQIIYWRLPRKNRSLEDTRLSIEKQGRRWLAKADADWWAEVRLSPKEARAARLIIEERGLITCQTMRFFGNPTTHISINEEAFMEAWGRMLAIPAEERDAGRTEEFKAKRVAPKKAGSKPTSGNRTPRKKAMETESNPDLEGPEGEPMARVVRYRRATPQESRYYPFRNNGITQRVITGLPKGQKPDYPKGNNPITERVISLTESPAEIPPEIPSENSPERKSNSINSFTGDARATQDPDAATGAVGEPQPQVPHGTGADAPGQAEADSVSASRHDDASLSNATAPEQVPPAAPGSWAILALRAVPRAELDARENRPISATLRALTKHTHRPKELPEFLAATVTQTGTIPRTYLLKLTPDELLQVTEAAKADAGTGFPGGFDRAAAFGLDRLIGAPISAATIDGRAADAPAPLGQAYEVKPRAAEGPKDAPVAPSRFVAGSSWREIATGTVLVLQEAVVKKSRNAEGIVYQMSNASLLSQLDLRTKYEFVD